MRLARAGIAVVTGCVLAVGGSGGVGLAGAADEPMVKLESAKYQPPVEQEPPILEVTVTYRCAEGAAKYLKIYTEQSSPEPDQVGPAKGESQREEVECNGENNKMTRAVIVPDDGTQHDFWHHPGSGEVRAVLWDENEKVVAKNKRKLSW
ncbi:hypothetical protein ACFWF7_01365 [Nocardia sp. NPDC060256]|uniref:hypothetical protein n=1 Tax=unclassified Nocardia TaxID=2637762 RepID=UPI0036584FAA